MIDWAEGRDGAQLPRRNLGPVVQGDGGRYSWVVRPSCDSLAWTYYEAVHLFGALVVSRADLDRAAAYKAALERRR